MSTAGVVVSGDGTIHRGCCCLGAIAPAVLTTGAGFWLVGRLFGMDVKTTLRTRRVQQTFESLTAFAPAVLLFLIC